MVAGMITVQLLKSDIVSVVTPPESESAVKPESPLDQM